MEVGLADGFMAVRCVTAAVLMLGLRRLACGV